MFKNCSSHWFTEAYSYLYTQGMILFIIVAIFMLCEHSDYHCKDKGLKLKNGTKCVRSVYKLGFRAPPCVLQQWNKKSGLQVI